MTQATYVRTDTIPLAQLTPFPGNAKRGDVGAILSSLARNGQYRALVVREVEPDRYVVLAGNHTTQALAAHGPGDCGMTVKAGDEERPCGVCGNQPWEPAARCEVVHCDDDTATRINLVDNRASDLGTYDEQALADLIGGLDDLGGTGWTDGECWPTCQDMAEPEGAPGTWTVTYRWGLPLDEAAIAAVSELTCQLILACLPPGTKGCGECRLPGNVTRVVRRGVEIEMADPTLIFGEGRTGLPLVDLWLSTVNPHRLASPSRVFSPDLKRPRVTTWP
ncbi:ParB/Srx family N-terminal domain-containing protein [Streptomyces sp. TRM70308]|uniref:hypothetical protein n=1 Tax=Streptomyces sp. TRM70308 TaxID=3131932 RepID=UPI003D010BAB